MDLGIKDKVAFITGASSGIGLSTAEAFVKEGARVIICGRNQEKLEEAKKKIKQNTGAEVGAYSCDTSKFDQVEKTVSSMGFFLSVKVTLEFFKQYEPFFNFNDFKISIGTPVTLISYFASLMIIPSSSSNTS